MDRDSVLDHVVYVSRRVSEPDEIIVGVALASAPFDEGGDQHTLCSKVAEAAPLERRQKSF